MATADDVLTAGSERRSLWASARLRRWRLVAVLTIVVVLAGLALDQWQRHREMDALLTAVTSGEQSISAADGSLAAVVSYYSPVIFRPSATERLRTGFRADLSRAAQEGATGTKASSSGVSAVRILPWHRSLLEARTEYLARVDAWSTYLESITTEPYDRFGRANDILPSTIRAREALERAAPWPWAGPTRARVDALLAP